MKNFNRFFLMYLVFSIMFLFPMSISQVNAAQGISATEVGNLNLCPQVNIKDSLIMSVVTMCLGGILEKTYEWREIQCQSVVCKYEAVKYGLDPAFCEDQQSYLTCSYIVGEVFAFPPLNVLDYFREAIAGILANPVGVLWGATVKLSRLTVTSACFVANPGILCNVAENIPIGPAVVVVVIADTAYVIQTILDIFENGFSFLDSESGSACEQIPDIKKEMQEIMGVKTDSEEESEGLFGLGFLGL